MEPQQVMFIERFRKGNKETSINALLFTPPTFGKVKMIETLCIGAENDNWEYNDV